MTGQQDPGQEPRNDPVSTFSDPKLMRPVAKSEETPFPYLPTHLHSFWRYRRTGCFVITVAILAIVLAIVLFFIH
jgi:hypothetical protein